LRSVAWAQGAARDQGGALTAGPAEVPKSTFEKKFAGSYAELSTYVGSGTFYAGGYHNPYLSNAIYLKPVYHLDTRRDLTLNARLYLETEYTQPDNPQARRFTPLDPWLWLAARNLYTEPRSKIRFGATARLVLPLSYESRYANLLLGVGGSGSATREFEFGSVDAQGKRWGLALTLGLVLSKSLHSSVLRGNGPGDSTGCLASGSAPVVTDAAAPTTASSDRCGGPLNTSFSVMTSGGAILTRGRWTAAMTLIVVNAFRYTAPVDAFAPTDVPLGRDDSTWGILALGYDIRPHLGLSAGVSSAQPALDARYRYPRFPFFDLSGANANTYTQLFVSLNGTI
jgi:hypothetical protein